MPRFRRPSPVFLLFLLILLLVSGVPASAGALCGQPPRVRVFPELSQKAPVNTHVWIELPRAWRRHGLCAGAECAEGIFELELRSAPGSARQGSAIDVRQRLSESGIVATAELVPNAPLAPNTRYEVWLRDGTSRAEPRIIGLFGTGTATDTESPNWKGLEPPVASPKTKPVPSAAPGKPHVVTIPDECGTPLVVLSTEPAIDRDSPSRALRYAVWVGDERDQIDFAAPPVLYARMGRLQSNLLLGNTDPEMSDFSRPKFKNGFRLVVRAVDWAGHFSEPSEIRLP